MITRIQRAALSLMLSCACQAAPAFAAEPGVTEATLSIAPPIPVHRVIDGRAWDCKDAACTASAASDAESQPIARECNRAARELGAFAAYQTGRRALTAAELAKCNSGARYLAKG